MIRIWIGRRESDILTYSPNIFNYSITYYGSNNKVSNFAFCVGKRTQAKYDKPFCLFIINCIKDISCYDSNYELYFYNSTLGQKLEKLQPSIKKHFKNCNSYTLLDWLNNKSYVRLWLSNTVIVPPFALLSKEECYLSNLKYKFPDSLEFIIQKNYSAGGKGTYRLTKETEPLIMEHLSSALPYLVSPYLSNAISACCHVIIGEKSCIIFPIGFQIISDNMNTMNYLGTTYKKPRNLQIENSKIEEFILNISRLLAQNGYRGICGYDFLIQDEQLILIEINPRYMASSYLLNYILSMEQLPSLFELNNMAFANDNKLSRYINDIAKLTIPYETRTIYYEENLQLHLPREYELYFDDGLDNVSDYEDNSYLYHYIRKC